MYISYLVAIDDEAIDVFILSCLLLLTQMAQQMFQSSPAMLSSLETLVQLLRHSPQIVNSHVVAIHNHCMSNALSSLTPGLGLWVKPRNTTWFSTFFLLSLMTKDE
jgi:hypothetical protein